MSQLQGLVEHVETWPARSFAEAAAAISDTVVYVADAAPFFTDAGTCAVDIDGLTYTATPTSADDPDTDYLTVSPALTVAVAEGDPIVLVPAAEVKWAWISFPDDDSGDLMRARVPHELVGYVSLTDGPREQSVRETVEVETDPEPTVVDVPNQKTSIDATTTPIIVTTEDGESVRIDGDGITTYTNDPVPIRTIIRSGIIDVAIDDTYLYFVRGGEILKYTLADGVEVTTGGFPKTGVSPAVWRIETDGTSLFTVGPSGGIRKFSASTAAETIGGGWPISGGFTALAVAGSFVYARDSTTADIRKFAVSNGAETIGSGFPIAGSFSYLAADGTHVYGRDTGTGGIRKFAVSDGAEDVTDFPIPGTFWGLASDGDVLYAVDVDEEVAKFDASTGDEITTGSFPIAGDFNPTWTDASLSINTAVLVALSSRGDVRVYNRAEGYPSTLTDSSAGTWDGHAVTVSDLTATGDTVLEGRTVADNLSVTTTKMSRVAAQNATTGTQVVVDFDTFEGSGTSGATDFWSESGGTVTIAVTGVYDIAALPIVAANITGLRRVRILINGAAYLDYLTDSVSASVTWKFPLAIPKVPLSAGDTIQLEIQQTSGVTLSLAGSWMSIARAGVLAA